MRIAAADWSMYPRKRWMCAAVDGAVSAPQPVRDAPTLLSEFAGAGPAVVGFDFPIGLPAAYCEKRQIGHFLSVLDFGWGVTNSPSLEQPFFPHTPGYKMEVLERALGLSRSEWLRECDRLAKAGAPFWTTGPKQAGRAAISGWREVLRHRPPGWRIWPFEPVEPGGKWIAEIYPAHVYRLADLAPNFGKRTQAGRRAQAEKLLTFAESLPVRLSDELLVQLQTGFGEGEQGEDAFDAFAGLLGMVHALRSGTAPATPASSALLRWEGWILGLEVEPGHRWHRPQK